MTTSWIEKNLSNNPFIYLENGEYSFKDFFELLIEYYNFSSEIINKNEKITFISKSVLQYSIFSNLIPMLGGIFVPMNPKSPIDEITKKIKSRKKKKRKPLPRDLIKPWVIQVGAFGKYENANRLKKQIQSNGYSAEVHAVNSNGKRLHAVRIVRFLSKKDAEKIGKGLKKKFGLDFRVLNNPE